MSKSYREEQEVILDEYAVEYYRWRSNDIDTNKVRKARVMALESLQVLHEREVRRIIGQPINRLIRQRLYRRDPDQAWYDAGENDRLEAQFKRAGLKEE